MKKGVYLLIFFFLSVASVFFVSSCGKKKTGPEFDGAWSNRKGTTKLTVGDGQAVYGAVTENGKSTSASGKISTKGGKLVIGLKKISMQAPPTARDLGMGHYNYYIVLNNDTLFKSPFISGSDYFCNDGIQNNGETGLDCGGKCSECGTVDDCDDGAQTPGEMGIDCGGACEPCASSACYVALGFGENAYLASGSAALQDSAVEQNNELGGPTHKVVLNFPAGSVCRSYEISFYNEVFLYMPVNTTELFKTYNTSVVQKPNSCLVEVVMNSGTRLSVQPGQKLFIVKNAESNFNIKFCNLEADKKTGFNLDTRFSANANFQLQKL